MINNILNYLEQTAQLKPDKIAFAGETEALSFQQVYDRARAAGSFLYNAGIYKKPVVVFMEKGPSAIAATFGVIYAGNFYVVIDEEMPAFRIELILKTLDAEAMICDASTFDLADKTGYTGSS